MRTPPEELGDFRLADILAFLAVRRWGSITAAARELKVTPSQVSKAVSRLEEQLQLPLLARGARGVMLSDVAERVLPHLEEVVARWRLVRRAERQPLRELTIAAPSYLNVAFMPRIAEALPQVRIRDLELPPPLIRALLAQNLFDLTIALGDLHLPESWTSICLGEAKKGLFGNPALARRLGPQPVTVERLREVPFISPIHIYNGQYIQLDDGCPLHYGKRRLGHEVLTIGLALELATCAEQLVFGPALAAHRYLERGLLVEIAVDGWQVSEPLYLACSINRVLARDQRALAERLRAALLELQRDGPAATRA